MHTNSRIFSIKGHKDDGKFHTVRDLTRYQNGESRSMLEKLRTYIRKIPSGKVATYGDVARAAGHAGAARQVVWALRGGHDLPWHRVVGAGGRISLTGENGLEQRLRLESEGVRFKGSRVDMEECGHFRHKGEKIHRAKETIRSKSARGRNRSK